MNQEAPAPINRVVSREEYERRMVQASAAVHDALRRLPAGYNHIDIVVRRGAGGRIISSSLRLQGALREMDELEPGEAH